MNRIKTTVQRLKVGWLMKSLETTVVDIGKQLESSGRVLVLLPSDEASRRKVLDDATTIASAFPVSEICLVSMPDSDVRVLARREGFRSFAPHSLEISWYGFPNKSFFNRIRNLRSRLVVDLDFDKSCFNAAVSAASGAPLRVGLFGIWGPPIHNIEIKSKISVDHSENIRSLLNVLSSLKAGAYN